MNITVFCGSKLGKQNEFKVQTEKLGQWMGQEGHTLVYGGATNGLMGIIADAVLENGGQAIGVVPDDIKALEDWHGQLTELIEVENLTQRKKVMSDRADAFIALPGGPGTLEEISEMISWARVKLHNKPCVIFNINGYYDSFEHYLKSMIKEEFIQPEDLSLVHFVSQVEEIANLLQ